jgi:hypothetical protein
MDVSTKGRGKPKGGKPALSVVPQAEVVHLAKGQGRNAYGLTSKQEAFCQGVGSRGETLAVAYRSAYDAENMLPHTVHNEACKLMGRPDIAARVNASLLLPHQQPAFRPRPRDRVARQAGRCRGIC